MWAWAVSIHHSPRCLEGFPHPTSYHAINCVRPWLRRCFLKVLFVHISALGNKHERCLTWAWLQGTSYKLNLTVNKPCWTLTTDQTLFTSGSPLAVCFRGLVARQTPHVFNFETGRFVGPPRQRGQPLQGHEGEKSCIVHRVLMSRGEKGTVWLVSVI